MWTLKCVLNVHYDGLNRTSLTSNIWFSHRNTSLLSHHHKTLSMFSSPHSLYSNPLTLFIAVLEGVVTCATYMWTPGGGTVKEATRVPEANTRLSKLFKADPDTGKLPFHTGNNVPSVLNTVKWCKRSNRLIRPFAAVVITQENALNPATSKSRIQIWLDVLVNSLELFLALMWSIKIGAEQNTNIKTNVVNGVKRSLWSLTRAGHPQVVFATWFKFQHNYRLHNMC